MPKNITIPQKIIDDFNCAMDAFLKDPMCITATLVMPPKKVPCTACNGSGGIGNTGSNASWSGRPQKFGNLGNTCQCNGEGFVQEEVTEDICVRPYWTEKEWIVPRGENLARRRDSQELSANDLLVQIKTYMYNLPSIMNAVYMKFSNVPGLSPYRVYSFALQGEPFPHGLDHKQYCLSFWERSNHI